MIVNYSSLIKYSLFIDDSNRDDEWKLILCTRTSLWAPGLKRFSSYIIKVCGEN